MCMEDYVGASVIVTRTFCCYDLAMISVETISLRLEAHI